MHENCRSEKGKEKKKETPVSNLDVFQSQRHNVHQSLPDADKLVLTTFSFPVQALSQRRITQRRGAIINPDVSLAV